MKAKIDSELCIGCGICVGMCPGVFRLEDNKAVVFVEIVPADLCALCRQASQECPVQAITIKEP